MKKFKQEAESLLRKVENQMCYWSRTQNPNTALQEAKDYFMETRNPLPERAIIFGRVEALDSFRRDLIKLLTTEK